MSVQEKTKIHYTNQCKQKGSMKHQHFVYLHVFFYTLFAFYMFTKQVIEPKI